VLRSLWLTCVLSVASATAWAQPAQTSVAATSAAKVQQAQQNQKAAEQKLVQLTNQRIEQRRRYDEQLSAIERIKKQKASWRRDRELNKAYADANDTAKRLTAIDNQLKTAQQTLGKARSAVVVAIDAELAAGASGARAEQLTKLRAQLSPATPAPKKIVIPDAEIDLLADSEELERQAAALAAVERQLESQRKGLDQQHKDLKLVAELRSAHDRAGELSTRDDDQPHRGAQRPSGGRGNEAVTAGAPQEDSGGGAGSGAQNDSSTGGDNFGSDKLVTTSFESSAIALGEVIDKSTIEGMLRLSRSADPKQRAEAARMARDAVAKRIKELQAKRAEIEKRAKKLKP
jgi:hypothetical protein